MDNGQEAVISFAGADILNGETPVVYGLNMEVRQGDIVYIIGKVGTGKTSIIRTITAENKLGGGAGSVCGYDLAKIKSRDIPYLRRRLGVVFQDFQLLMDRTVQDNLKFVLKSTGWKDKRAIAERIALVLESVGMTTKAHKMPHQLSGGEQQRVCIARAILNDPEVIIADEPTGNLDRETAEEILQLLRKINREKGTAIVMVTHDRSICERHRGRIFETRDEACVEITPSEDSISIDAGDFETEAETAVMAEPVETAETEPVEAAEAETAAAGPVETADAEPVEAAEADAEPAEPEAAQAVAEPEAAQAAAEPEEEDEIAPGA